MTPTNPDFSEKQGVDETSSESEQVAQVQPPSTSATTQDEPAFGWSGYAERVNGRFAMLGFISILLIEAVSQDSFLHWAGLLP